MKRMLLGFALALAVTGVAWSAAERERPDPRAMALERAALALGFDDAQKAAVGNELAKMPFEAAGELLRGARKTLFTAAAEGGADALAKAGEALLDELAAKEDAFLGPLMTIYGTLNETQRRIVAGHLGRGPHAGPPPPPHAAGRGAGECAVGAACVAGTGRRRRGEGGRGEGKFGKHGKSGMPGPFSGPGMRGMLGPELFADLHPDPAAMSALAAKVRDGSLQEADAKAALEAWRVKAKAALPAVTAKAAERLAKIPDEAKEKLRARFERFARKEKEAEEKKEAVPAPAPAPEKGR